MKEEKKSFWQEAMEMFARFGGPSGGFVHNDLPVGDEKNEAAKAAEPVKAEPAKEKEEKKSFWQEAMEMFARFGGPSGGFVHNDLPVKDEKVTEAAKSETTAKNEEKKSSYMDEVGKLYAAFGGPSGGFVHNDLPMQTAESERAEPKKAEADKKDKILAYKEEVSKMYAAFGGPSGGFVHNDLPAKEEPKKTSDTVKAAVLASARKNGGR